MDNLLFYPHDGRCGRYRPARMDPTERKSRCASDQQPSTSTKHAEPAAPPMMQPPPSAPAAEQNCPPVPRCPAEPQGLRARQQSQAPPAPPARRQLRVRLAPPKCQAFPAFPPHPQHPGPLRCPVRQAHQNSDGRSSSTAFGNPVACCAMPSNLPLLPKMPKCLGSERCDGRSRRVEQRPNLWAAATGTADLPWPHPHAPGKVDRHARCWP